MSLVNDMLRDLDKRNAPERAGVLGTQQASESMIEPQKPLPWAAIYSAVLLIILVFLGVWYLWFASRSATHVQLEQVQAPIKQTLDVALQDLSAVSNEQKEENKAAPKSMARAASVEQEKPSDLSIEADLAAKRASSLVAQKRVEKAPDVAALKPEKVLERAAPKEQPARNQQSSVDGKSSEASRVNAEALGEEKTLPLRNQAGPSIATQSPTLVEPSVLAKPLNVTLSPSALDLKAASDAISLFELGQSEQAYASMKEFIGSHSLSEKTKGVLANRLFADQRLSELQSLLQEEAYSLSPALRQVQARWLMYQGNVVQAISTLESSSPSMEDTPEYYALLASFYQRSGQSAKAFDQYSQLIQSNETVADWWAGLGVSADQLKQSRQAKFAYQQALELPGLNSALDSYIRQRLSALSSVR